MKHMADLSTEVEELMPSDINKTIPYIVKPFTPTSYDSVTGLMVIDSSISLRKARAGQVLVDPTTGNGYIIAEITPNGLRLAEDTSLTANSFAIVPKYQTYKVRREHSFFQESYSIGCHVSGETSQLLWLHAITLYSLLRYKESLLEARGFAETSFSSTDIAPNNAFGPMGGDNIYSRYINLSGMIENSWIKTPVRTIEAIDLVDNQGVNGLKAGIKIISNENSMAELDTEDDTWTTIKD